MRPANFLLARRAFNDSLPASIGHEGYAAKARQPY
jgi:hypothetical protein